MEKFSVTLEEACQLYLSQLNSVFMFSEWDEIAFEGMTRSNPGYGSDDNPVTAEIAWLLRLANGEKTRYEGDIFTTVYFPIHDDFSDDHKPVAVMRIVIHWARFFTGIFPDSTKGLVFVLSNGCDEPYTYQIDGKEVIPMGQGDLHDPKYDSTMAFESFRNVSSIGDGSKDGMTLHQDDCPYMIHVYSSGTSRKPVQCIVSSCALCSHLILSHFVRLDFPPRQTLFTISTTHRHQSSLRAPSPSSFFSQSSCSLSTTGKKVCILIFVFEFFV